MNGKTNRLLQLFLTTLYISSCTFGGGFVIVTFMKRQFVDEYAPRGRIVSTRINMKDEALQKAALEELYYYSSEFYAKKRAAEGK